MSNVNILKVVLLVGIGFTMASTFIWSISAVDDLEHWKEYSSQNHSQEEMAQIETMNESINQEVASTVAFAMVVIIIMIFGIVGICKEHTGLVVVFAALILPIATYYIHLLILRSTAKAIILFMFFVIDGFVLCFAWLVRKPKPEEFYLSNSRELE